MTLTPQWVALDWGSTHARAFAMDAQNRPLERRAEAVADLGGQTEAGLARLLEGWDCRAAPIVACGMIGAREGLLPAPYRAVPCKPLGAPLAQKDLPFAAGLYVVAGLSQAQPADVMRGEETQLAGLLSLAPNWDGTVCLPGTHTKWAQASAGEIVSFRSFMTGELYALLSKHSVLRHSMSEGIWQDEAFVSAFDASYARPEGLAARLFGIRAGDLLGGSGGGAAALSGLLLGAELAAAKPWWLGQDVVILGEEGLGALYRTALERLGVTARLAPADDVTLAGLIAAYTLLKG